MYLFTLVFIFLTIFGIFTEIVTLQNNRFAAMRTGGAQQLLTWHTASVTAARYTIGGAPIFTWGAGASCTLLATGQALGAGMPAECKDLQPGAGQHANLDNLNIAWPPAAGSTINLLPVGYDVANMRFNTVFLTDAGGTNARLAVTFLGPAANDGDSLAPIGLTGSQLYRQLLRLNVDKFNFGYVVNNQLQPASMLFDEASLTTVTGAYTLPATLVFDAVTNPTGPMRSGALALFTPL